MEGPSTLGGYDEEGCEEEDVCRICRMPGEPGSPLYYPCQCNGSIRWVHQDCLLQWLKHSSAVSCEVRSAARYAAKFFHWQKPFVKYCWKCLSLAQGHCFSHISCTKYPSCSIRACISYGYFRVSAGFRCLCPCYRVWSGLSSQIVPEN
jgi:hypothetical protein